MRNLFYLTVMAFMLMSCREDTRVYMFESDDSVAVDTTEKNDDIIELSETVGEGTEKVISIPFEFDNPVANLVVFDIDKGGCKSVVSDVDFSFEVLTHKQEEDTDRIVEPVSEYKDEYFSLSMENGNTCKLEVFGQEEPYCPIDCHIVFYNVNNEILEDFYLIVGEDATDKEY